MQNLKVTVIQGDLAWQNVEKNLGSFDAKLASLKETPDLVVLPEMFTTGFTMHPEACAETMEGAGVQYLLRWSRALGAEVTGSIAVRDGGGYVNRLLWAKPDGTLLHCDKRHLFRMAGEEKVYRAGNSCLTVKLKGWKLRPFICYDLRFPVWTRNRGSEYDAAVFVANWPESRREHWRALLRARAIENQCYVIGVNRVGVDGNGVSYSGDSAVIDYNGTVLFENRGDECVRTEELSLKGLRDYRESFPAWKDADPFFLGH